MDSHPLNVSIISPQGVLFEGQAQRVILPGESGVFEVLINHKPLLSRLLPGELIVDNQTIPILRGVTKIAQNHVLAIVETRQDG